MKITNDAGLHPKIYRAIQRRDEWYTGPKNDRPDGLYSVTELLKPSAMVVLERRHDHEIEVEAEELMWMLVGSAMHKAIELGAGGAGAEQSMSEERLTMPIRMADGTERILSGASDDVEFSEREGAWLADFKYTTVWTYIFQDRRDEWNYQVNLYRLMWERLGFPIDRMTVEAIFRDWSAKKARFDGAYPRRKWARFKVPKMAEKKLMAFVRERIGAIEDALRLPDAELIPCTLEERWEKPAVWAVMKKGLQRATRVLDTREGAMEFIAEDVKPKDQKRCYIEHRPGERTRCDTYCRTARWCRDYQDYLAKKDEGNVGAA